MDSATFEITLEPGSVVHMRPQHEFVVFVQDLKSEHRGRELEVFAGPSDAETRTAIDHNDLAHLRERFDASSAMKMMIQFSRRHLSFVVMMHSNSDQDIESLAQSVRIKLQGMANAWPSKFQELTPFDELRRRINND